MGNKFAEIAVTPGVRAIHQSMGSSKHYDRLKRGDTSNERLGPDQTDFIFQRDSFYMASVSETGWPYVQHRGGPPVFLKCSRQLQSDSRITAAIFNTYRRGIYRTAIESHSYWFVLSTSPLDTARAK